MMRLAALEKENAAIRKENAALRENKTLRERNAALESSAGSSAPVTSAPAAKPNAFDAYAADLPMAYKAPISTAPGRFCVWGEGGAVFPGGSALNQSCTTFDPTLGILNGARRSFDLLPKTG